MSTFRFILISTLILLASITQGQITHLAHLDISQVIKKEQFIYIATKSTGLIKIDLTSQKVWHYHALNSDICSNYLNSIAIDMENNIWVNTKEGLCKFSETEGRIGVANSKYYKQGKLFINEQQDLWLFQAAHIIKIGKDGSLLKRIDVPYSYYEFIRTIATPEGTVHKRASQLYQLENDTLRDLGIKANTNRLKLIKDTLYVFGDKFTKKIKDFKVQEETQIGIYGVMDAKKNIWHIDTNRIFQIDLAISRDTPYEDEYYPLNNNIVFAPDSSRIHHAFFDEQNTLFLITKNGCFQKKEGSRRVETVVLFENFITYPPEGFVKIKMVKEKAFWTVHHAKMAYYHLNDKNEIQSIQGPTIKPYFPNELEILDEGDIHFADTEGSIFKYNLAADKITKEHNQLTKNNLPEDSQYCEGFQLSKDSTLWVFGRTHFIALSPDQTIDTFAFIGEIKNVENVQIDLAGNLYLKKYSAMYQFNDRVTTKMDIPIPKTRGNIGDIEVDHLGNIYAVKGDSYILKKVPNEPWRQIAQIRRQYSYQETKIIGTGMDNTIYLQMDKIIYQISLEEVKTVIFRNDKEYFAEVYAATSDATNIYLTTNTGIFILPKE